MSTFCGGAVSVYRSADQISPELKNVTIHGKDENVIFSFRGKELASVEGGLEGSEVLGSYEVYKTKCREPYIMIHDTKATEPSNNKVTLHFFDSLDSIESYFIPLLDQEVSKCIEFIDLLHLLGFYDPYNVLHPDEIKELEKEHGSRSRFEVM